jgi:hypothetical protein
MKRLWVCSYCRNLQLGTTLCPLFFNTSTVYTMPFLVTKRHVVDLVLPYSLPMKFYHIFLYFIKGLQHCRRRYCALSLNFLKPDINWDKFSLQEEETIIQLRARLETCENCNKSFVYE